MVYSSVNLEEKVITCEGERPQTRKRKKKGTELLLGALGKTEIIRLYGLRREKLLALGLAERECAHDRDDADCHKRASAEQNQPSRGADGGEQHDEAGDD